MFQAHVAIVKSVEEVRLVKEKIMEDRKVARATHNIMAYRILQENGVMIKDNDEDGETAAGGRLAHLLDLLEVENVVVIVSRWYGGIMLGNDRFKHINNVARDLLHSAGFLDSQQSQKNKKKSKN